MCEAVIDGSCVVIVPRKMNWYQARDNCIQKGGRILEVHTRATHDIISNIASGMNLLLCVIRLCSQWLYTTVLS